MANEVSTAAGHINRGVREFEAGNLDAAREHFTQAVKLKPDGEKGWLWLAEVSDDPGVRRYCLNRAVQINPDSVARDEWMGLHNVDPIVPPGVADVHRPPMPPSFQPASPSRSFSFRARRRARGRAAGGGRRWPIVALVVLLLLAMVGAMLLQREGAGEHRYIAVAAPFSGPDAEIGRDARDGAQLAVDQLNARHDGPDLKLVVFDDKNDPDVAADVAREIVEDDRILAVVGHSSSATTLAAAPIYEEAGLPVVSGQATADELDGVSAFFRVATTDTIEGTMLATYASTVLGFDKASLIAGPGVYEQEVGHAFTGTFAQSGTVGETWNVLKDRDAAIAEIVEAVGSVPDDTIVLLSLTHSDAHDVLMAIRRAGHTPHLLGVEALGTDKFAEEFSGEPEEVETPGYFTEGLYAASPLIFDSAVGDSLAFARAFSEDTGRTAGWRGAHAHDAVVMIAHAIRSGAGDGDKSMRRQGVMDALRAIDSADVALRGATGPLYFDASGNVPGALNMGVFREGYLISAPVQYQLVPDADLDALAEDLESGVAFAVEDQVFRQLRVAYVGIEMIELRDLNTNSQTFTADFFMYFRYTGDDTPTNVTFTNSTASDLSVGDPIAEATDEHGLTYKLYRVKGTFSQPMQFKDYPWDQHELAIRFQNPLLDQTELVYAADLAAIEMPQSDRLTSGFDRSQPFNRIPNWDANNVQFAQYAVTSASDDYSTDNQVQYSEFRTLIEIERQTSSFLFKNLLPLGLLTLVTYIFLWFPAEQAGTRVGASITALLTSAVMLNSVSSQLPDIGYTVAIEWGFYIYLGVAAVLVILNVLVDRNFKAKRLNRVRALDATIRILFPAIVLGTVMGYVVAYA